MGRSKLYIHYGATEFSPERFEPIKNRMSYNKPTGGLWASALSSKYGWKQWCRRNDFDSCNLKKSFRFKLNTKRIFVIDSCEKAHTLPRRKKDPFEIGIELTYPVLPDFELLAKEYDAIDFRISSDSALYFEMYTWDCDSILVLNQDVIEVV